MFSFDVFEGCQSIWNKLAGFLIHNIPSLALIAILISTWNTPLFAGAIFFIAGICITIFLHTYQRWDSFLLISFPAILAGGLYFLDYFLKKKALQNKQEERKEF